MTLHEDFPYRIGYACINTILSKEKEKVFCSRKCIITTIKKKDEEFANGVGISGIEYLKELGKKNILDLEKIILWNEENNIRFMRLSSEMFPFAGHEIYGYSLDYCQEELTKIGNIAKKLKHRLTSHPGQFNNLGSPTEKIVQDTIRDLSYHAEMLDRMGLDSDSVMIIHMGGVYGDKEAAIQRFEKVFKTLPKNVADRLVLENDEYSYNVEEILPTCKRLNVPMIFDYHHHMLNPGTRPFDELYAEIQETWKRRGIRQKVHYSESRLGATTIAERRAHSDIVKDIPMCGKECDLMIEAKEKEQAVLRIYRKYNVFPVNPENITEITEPETMRVVDKSRKKKKKKLM